MSPDEIGTRIRRGQLLFDADFDAWLPEPVRGPSGRYWTQVGVAARATRWLAERGVASVLDVGSGAGKFCVVGALCSNISFTGIEQRGHLVEAARSLAARFGVEARASFVHGELDALDFRRFDALYLYNPFGENVFPVSQRLDDTVEISRARFVRDTTTLELALGSMPVGSQLVTYNGCGGRVPDSFDLVQAKIAGINLLRLFQKTREESTGGYWLECEDDTLLRPPRRSSSGK